MSGFSPFDRAYQCTASDFCCPREEELQYVEEPTSIFGKLRMAQTWVKEIYDHQRLAISLYPLSHFTTVEDLKQLRHLISVLHVRGFFVVQRVEDVGAILFRKGSIAMYLGGHDGQVGCYVEPHSTLLQFGEDHKG